MELIFFNSTYVCTYIHGIHNSIHSIESQINNIQFIWYKNMNGLHRISSCYVLVPSSPYIRLWDLNNFYLFFSILFFTYPFIFSIMFSKFCLNRSFSKIKADLIFTGEIEQKNKLCYIYSMSNSCQRLRPGPNICKSFGET